MTVTADDIKAKKAEVSARQMDALLLQNKVTASAQEGQNALAAARVAVVTASGELAVLQLQKQIDDAAAQP